VLWFEQFTLQIAVINMNNLPMLYRDHNFTVFKISELVKHLKLESILILFLYHLSLKHSVIGKLISQPYVTVELILPENRLSFLSLTDLVLS